MFDYLMEKRRFCLKLGQIISHNIVQSYDPQTGTSIRSVEELNGLDRYALARNILNQMPQNLLTGEYEWETFVKDVAVYIDQRIPQSYTKWVTRDHDKSPSQTKADPSSYGLVYHFNEEKKTPAKTTRASAKKLSTDPTNEEATDLRTLTEKVKEANYAQLVDYLRANKIHISNEVFRAVLFTMNGMTLYRQTKTQAIQKASGMMGVPQTHIKPHIDAMGIKSERFIQSQKQFGKTRGMEIGLLKSRLARETDE